jgi:predicted MFS family arabinose efflux permease
MLELLARVLGGNPLEMLGVPSGIFFPYLLVTVTALPLSIHLGWYLGWRAKSNGPRIASALVVLIAVWANPGREGPTAG